MFQKLFRSFDNVTKNALSARKLTAFSVILCVLYGHYIYYNYCILNNDFKMYDIILIIDYCAVAFFLGLITAEQIIKLKNDKNEDETKNPTIN